MLPQAWSLETAQGDISSLKMTNNVSPNKASAHQPEEQLSALVKTM
jgi:hypothetical protein